MQVLCYYINNLNIIELHLYMQTINEAQLFMKYKSSYTSASYDFIRHLLFTSATFYSIYQLKYSYWSILPTILLGFLNVKTFIIFHDCGHQSYTPSTHLNQFLGIITGALVGTPFSWSIRHDTHHATNGNIENKYDWRYNEHIYYTVREYKAMSPRKQQLFRWFISPEIFYLFMPLLNFLVLERFSVIKFLYRKTRHIHNIVYLVLEQFVHNTLFGLFMYGLWQYQILYPWLLSLWIASNIGVMLFHNQHTFNPPYITTNELWTVKDSGLKGSSYIEIPLCLKYFTGGIEYHHIHHMNSKIPGYNLQQYHEEVVKTSTVFNDVYTMSMQQFYYNLWLVLYDNVTNKYVMCKNIL